MSLSEIPCSAGVASGKGRIAPWPNRSDARTVTILFTVCGLGKGSSRAYRSTIWPVVSVPDVPNSVQDHGYDQREAHDQMGQEHDQVEPVLIAFARGQPHDPDGHEIHGVDDQKREERKETDQENLQLRTDDRAISRPGRWTIRSLFRVVNCAGHMPSTLSAIGGNEIF